PALTKGRARRFTIKVKLAAQTAISRRDEITVFEAIPSHEFRGHGHEFEKKYTLSQIRNGTSHHLMVSYRLGGLSLLVRHETDGYIWEPKPVTKLTRVGPRKFVEPEACSTEKTAPKTKIQKLGHIVSRDPTLEIKTRSFKNRLTTILKLIWRFPTPRVQDVIAELKDWERAHQNDIKKLVALIQNIIRATRQYGGCATILYDVKKDVLVVKKAERKKMLPDDVYSRWTEPDTKTETSLF
ncbi:geranylgeranyl pyrophosphate synthetase, partial [Penicillium sp. IBT 35674x]